MMTREEAKTLVDTALFNLVLQSMLNPDVESISVTDALCFVYSMSVMGRAFPKADLADKDFGIAVGTQSAILASAIDDGALSKQYIYDTYVDLVQKADEENDDKENSK